MLKLSTVFFSNHTTGDAPLLVSLNDKYRSRRVAEGERFEVLGIAIDVVRPEEATEK